MNKKLIGGLLLLATGIVGIFWGASQRDRIARIVILSVSIVAIIGGTWLSKSGYDSVAMMQAGQKLDETKVMFQFKSYESMKKGFEKAFSENEKIKRIRLVCPDGSRFETIYNTPIGIMGLPHESIKCEDGKYLVKLNGKS